MTREEAIEYLHKLFMQADITDAYGDMDDTEPYETAIDMAVKALSDAPDINVGDMISRQAAIDEFNTWKPLRKEEREILNAIIDTLKLLPSAEPEIIYCKDCVHHIDGFFCRQANHHTSDKDYCASVFRAERRTDE